jgi:hypothetical protein
MLSDRLPGAYFTSNSAIKMVTIGLLAARFSPQAFHL